MAAIQLLAVVLVTCTLEGACRIEIGPPLPMTMAICEALAGRLAERRAQAGLEVEAVGCIAADDAAKLRRFQEISR